MQELLKIIKPCDENCPIRKTVWLLWWKWTLLILFQINERTIRFGELKRAIPGISEKMLIQELSHLVSYGLVSKKVYPEIPPKVEYTLTQWWLETLPIMEQLAKFGLENL